MSTTVQTDQTTESASQPLAAQEKRLRHELGFWSLTATSFGGIIGSGWLFGAFYGAQIAGPAALISWLIAGVAVSLVALVLIELGASRPEAGGSVRWPLYANGRLVGTLVGWSALLALASSTEVLAILQYAAHYFPWLFHGSTLSVGGIFVAAALLAVLTVINWYGIRLFARINTAITAVKFIVPAITIIALLASGFHPSHLTDHGGFAPNGWSSVLSAVATGGLIYSVNGFQPPVDLSGEARNPRRDVPRSILVAIGASVLLYLLLQFAFIVAIPDSALGHGWHGIDFTSPFGQLALLLNLGWLASILYADAVLSPAGTQFVGTAENGRTTYALAKNRLVPKFFLEVDGGSGVPRRALLLNFVLGLLVLIPLHSWISVVSVIGDVFLLNYAIASVAAGTFRAAAPTGLAGWIPGIKWIAPASFLVSTEIIYWSGWSQIKWALPLTLIGLIVFAVLRTKDRPLAQELRTGAWLPIYLVGIIVFSYFGSPDFGGDDSIGTPWDSIIVAVFGLALYAWAVREGTRHIERTASLDIDDSPVVSEALSLIAQGR
ncbi:APC family permease [Actinospica sp.]|uniref:APC family permease n=1 Tax=Actinospica sp. TaxID=1872142 RepID=UPI002C3C962B|nr:APC family permease [Actinospica sp.]HWG28778.1 APC family permease [Actinospica sp.]